MAGDGRPCGSPFCDDPNADKEPAMTTPTLDFLESSMQKAREWLGDFIECTGRPDTGKAWQMMRAVLHVLRDRVTVEQCAHLSAQLPLLIRGVYFEGWRPVDQPRPLRSQEEFVRAVGEGLTAHPEIDPRQAIEGTFRVLGKHVTAGELEKIKNMLQPEINQLWS
jgi:uncharacterized protein (DUF2267 family)